MSKRSRRGRSVQGWGRLRRQTLVKLGLIVAGCLIYAGWSFWEQPRVVAQTLLGRPVPAFLAEREPPPQAVVGDVTASIANRRAAMAERFRAHLERKSLEADAVSDAQRTMAFGEVELPRDPLPPPPIDGFELRRVPGSDGKAVR